MDIDDLENLIWLIENQGEIVIGSIGPAPCAAVASDKYSQLAALIKKPNETVGELLLRLDLAIQKADEEEIYIDEINS